MMGYGYENAAGDRISALIDMINGGGPGRSGDTFEGGGILSLLANAVAKPYGSVRERPGHTPVGAAAPTSMDVLRPEPVDAAVLPGSDTAVPVDMLRSVVEGAIDRAEATGGRTFREEDFAVLGRLHPEVAKLFSGVRVGDPLSRQQAMFLNAASVGLDAPSAALTFPAPTGIPAAPATAYESLGDPFSFRLYQPEGMSMIPTAPLGAMSMIPTAPLGAMSMIPTARSAAPAAAPAAPPEPLSDTSVDIAPATAYESLGEPTLFTQDQLDAMSPAMKLMAEEHNRENAPLVAEAFRVPAAPVVSPLPEDGPAADTASAAGAVPVADAPPTDATAAPLVSLRPEPRPAADTSQRAERKPVRIRYNGYPYLVFPDRRVVDARDGTELTAEYEWLRALLLRQAGMDIAP